MIPEITAFFLPPTPDYLKNHMDACSSVVLCSWIESVRDGAVPASSPKTRYDPQRDLIMTESSRGFSPELLLPVDVILLNEFMILVVIFLIFAGIFLYHKLVVRKELPRLVTPTLTLSLVGLLLLSFEFTLRSLSGYGTLITPVQNLIALFCLANLIIYFVLEVVARLKTGKTPPTFLRDIVTMVVYLLFALIALRVVFHIEISSIITTTTVLTAAIAFAMQTALANAVSGFSIQNDPLLKQGSWIEVRDRNIAGRIINVGFRYTTLENIEGHLFLVPNSLLIQNPVTSFGSPDTLESRVATLLVTLGYEVPPEAGRALILGVLDAIPDISPAPAPQAWIVSLGENGVTYQLRFGLRDMALKERISDPILSQVWYAVQRAGYSFPYPHREVMAARPRDPFAFSPEVIAAAVSECALFTALDEAERSVLVSQTRLQVYGPGETVVRQDDAGCSLFIVLKGELLAVADKVVVGTLGAGDLFGERSLLTGEPRRATITARSEVRLLEISAAAIGPVIRENPALMEQLSEVLAHREEANRESLRNAAASLKVGTRKDEYLLKLRHFFGFDDPR